MVPVYQQRLLLLLTGASLLCSVAALQAVGRGACAYAPTDFKVLAEPVNKFLAPGSPCDGTCYAFFSNNISAAAPTFSLVNDTKLVLSSAADPKLIGHTAFGRLYFVDGRSYLAVEFGKPSKIHPGEGDLECTMQADDDSGGGSCKLNCTAPFPYGDAIGSRVDPTDGNQWYLGHPNFPKKDKPDYFKPQKVAVQAIFG